MLWHLLAAAGSWTAAGVVAMGMLGMFYSDDDGWWLVPVLIVEIFLILFLLLLGGFWVGHA